MKKNFVYAMMSAIALTGAVSLTSCSSNEEVADVNPTFDGNGVKTDFAFNISKTSQATTRMSGTNTQQDGGNFLGMSNMYLFPFDGVPGTVTEPNNPYYYLGDLTGISAAQSSKVYSLTFPVGTDNFLFYGTATKTGTNFEQGKLNSSFSSLPTGYQISDISFSLEPISASLTDADKIAAYLTAIAKTTDWAGTVSLAATDGRYSGLSLLYQKFISNITARAGSAEAVERLILDLFKSARAINQESTVTEIKTIAGEICNKIDAEVDGVRVTVGASALNPDDWTAAIKGVNGTFPANLNLPMGSAQYSWDATNSKFTYTSDPSYAVSALATLSASTAINKYCYPSELVYFDNSPLRATSEYKKVSNYPITTTDWDTWPENTVGTGWTDTEVKSTTRAVAMTNNVNYGVALLETKVKLTQAALTDNMHEIVGGAAENQTITASASRNDADKESVFKVTGILIGGQPGQVGWNMIKSSSSDFSYVIYDNDVTFKDDALSTAETAENYTLVLDNYSQDLRDQSKRQSDVLIALQLVNDGVDFYGINGMIPAGNTFYLVGNLNLEGKSLTQATRPGTYRITNENITRVFVQDYKTVANITIKADALKRAYSAIPDLRSTEVVFGLSVDLNWESGITFNVEM
jgi:hypothetical protein